VGRGGEALAVEPSHFSTGSDATEANVDWLEMTSDSDSHDSD